MSRIPCRSLVLLFALAFACGCANPGPPRPPSLQLPALPTGLRAERVGDEVFLSWTTPANTTDGESITLLHGFGYGSSHGSMTASICRQLQPLVPAAPGVRAPGAVSAPACNHVLLLPVIPGPSRAVDPLPSALTAGPVTPLAYRVEIFNLRQRSAGLSPPIFTLAGAAPAPIGPLTIVPRRDGALLTWPSGATQPAIPAPASVAVEVKRTMLSSPVPVPAAALSLPGQSTPTPGRRTQSPTPGLSQPGTQASPSQEITLRSDRVEDPPHSSKIPNANGMVDRTVDDLATYTYTAQRVLSVSIAGRTLEVRGTASPPVTFTFHNTFPPRAPSGLVSVSNPGSAAGGSSIDLSWEANAEPDLLGYNIYRSEVSSRDSGAASSTSATHLNPEPVPDLAFRDLSALPGHVYLYTVTAIDRRRHESPPSASVRETLTPESAGHNGSSSVPKR